MSDRNKNEYNKKIQCITIAILSVIALNIAGYILYLIWNMIF